MGHRILVSFPGRVCWLAARPCQMAFSQSPMVRHHFSDHTIVRPERGTLLPIGSMVLSYMVTFTINIPQMLAYIPYMDPMGYNST